MIFLKQTFQQRIFFYFLAVFLVFVSFVLVFQYYREKEYREDQLEVKLDNISGFVNQFIKQNHLAENNEYSKLDSLKKLIPEKNIRITIIGKNGLVKYDSSVSDYKSMENHGSRPEIIKAFDNGIGSNIRHSETTGHDYYYYAIDFDDYYIRCAIVYNVEIENFLKTERVFIFFMIILFLIVWGLVWMVTRRLGEFITKLRDFAIRAGRDENIDTDFRFKDSDFGDIRKQIVQIYSRLKQTKDELTSEKERLFNHLEALNEGIAFFNSEKETLLVNSHFIHYINLISEKSAISADEVFGVEKLKPILKKVLTVLSSDQVIDPKSLPHFSKTISKNEMHFKIESIIFKDKSFEILISDITKPEKRRLLKQQLTSNIAHELKTPLSSIKGYLETIMESEDLPSEKKAYFTERAYMQSERLTLLLNDISLLNNIEDAGDLFEVKTIKLRELTTEVLENLESRLNDKGIKVFLEVEDHVAVYGNDSLLSSIFQNLIENSINYAGENIEIRIKQYLEDEKYYYFSYSDSGKGVPEEHLARIFERFYRVDPGRARATGGTGLGLSIVKNAVQLHKGEISVRNRKEKGLEFLFSLARD